MIYPSQAVRIVIATKPVDFRKGHDGLAALAECELGLDPHSGIIVALLHVWMPPFMQAFFDVLSK